MTAETAYRNSRLNTCCKGSGILSVFLILCLTFLLRTLPAAAQEPTDFEEISVVLYITQIGSIDIPAYLHGEELYLPVVNVFNFLKILSTPTPGFDTVSGFFINQQSLYLIDRMNSTVQYQHHVYKLPDGALIRTENNLYLKSNYFGEIFGLDCSFVFNSMSVTLTTKLELPVIKEMRQTLMRTNLGKLKGNITPDTAIKRNYPFFHFGAADWSVSAVERWNQGSDVRLNLALGAILGGGELSLNLNYTTNLVFDPYQQYYLWHFANNDLKLFRQVMVGKIPIQANIFLNAPVVGVQVSNTPTTFQRSFCSYTLSDYTQPGWIVELYVNHVLVDYMVADASGYFSFEVPLVYGNSLVKLRFYGPWGEERTREQNFRIPFNFLPPRKFEYTFNAGIVQDSHNSKYAKLNMNYGANRRLTLGGGMEYLSTMPSSPVMPFVNFSLRLATSLLISGEYTYGVRFKGILSYRLPRDISFELYYTNLNNNQKALNANFIEERRVVFSAPIRTRLFSSMARMTVNQIILPGSNYITSELLISSTIFGTSTNITTNALFLDPQHPIVYCNLSVGIRLPANFILTPQVQYLISDKRLQSGKIEVEKRIFRSGTVNVLFERNFLNQINNIQVGIRYDFNALQTNFVIRNSGNNTSFQQFARGSMVYEGKGGQAKLSRISSVGKGGIVVLSFLDINGNGKYDLGEQKISDMNLKINGGRVVKNSHDSAIHISDLEPYTTYYIELDRTGFENVSWQIPKPLISIAVNPNQYRLIELPVRIMGEVSGMVYLESDTVKSGLGGLYISIFRDDSSFVTRIISEEDGYFTYFGLPPGSYYAQLDKSQLKQVGMGCSKEVIPFMIQQSTEGDLVGGIEFILNKQLPLRNKKE